MKIRAFVALALFAGTASAGGIIASGYGIGPWVPKSQLTLTWSFYGAGSTEPRVNELSYAVASVDHDAMRWRLLWDDTPDVDRTHVYFSFKGSTPVDPRCLDEIEGNCPVASTRCDVWETDGSVRLCTAYRVFLYINNWDVSGVESVEERMYPVIRHELGHVLGFDDGSGGPMDSGSRIWTDCQFAQWDAFTYDPAVTGWTVLSVPECTE